MTEPGQRRSGQILVVDDESVSRSVSARILRKAGRTVVEADSFATAAHVCAGTAFAVIVCDLVMPDGTGLDLVNQLRAAGNQTPVILLTGVSDVSIASDDRYDGIAACLTKPVGSRELCASVDDVLAGVG